MANPSSSRFFEKTFNLLSVFFLLVGVYFSIPSVITLYKIQNAATWQETEGVIISADVQPKFLEEKASGQEYLAKIWFSYTVNGTKFLSDRFSFADEFTPSRSAVLKLVSDYPAGKKVKVFYDRTDFSFAVLARQGVPWKDGVFVCLGALFAISALVSLIGIFFPRRRD